MNAPEPKIELPALELFSSRFIQRANLYPASSGLSSCCTRKKVITWYPQISGSISLCTRFGKGNMYGNGTFGYDSGNMTDSSVAWSAESSSTYSSSSSSSQASSSTTMDSSSLSNEEYVNALLYAHYNLDPSINWKIPQYYSTPYQIIGTFFQGIIFIVGKCLFFVMKENSKGISWKDLGNIVMESCYLEFGRSERVESYWILHELLSTFTDERTIRV